MGFIPKQSKPIDNGDLTANVICAYIDKCYSPQNIYSIISHCKLEQNTSPTSLFSVDVFALCADSL